MTPTFDVKAALFLTPAEVAAIFRHEGDLKWVYRAARPGKFLYPFARRFNAKTLLFVRAGIDKLIAESP